MITAERRFRRFREPSVYVNGVASIRTTCDGYKDSVCPRTADSIFLPPYPFLRMSSPLRFSGHPNEPTGVGYSHDKKDVAFAVEMVDAGSDSDVNPGELTFEEGQSLQLCPPEYFFLTCNARHRWWDGSSPGCLQLHNAQVKLFPI